MLAKQTAKEMFLQEKYTFYWRYDYLTLLSTGVQTGSSQPDRWLEQKSSPLVSPIQVLLPMNLMVYFLPYVCMFMTKSVLTIALWHPWKRTSVTVTKQTGKLRHKSGRWRTAKTVEVFAVYGWASEFKSQDSCKRPGMHLQLQHKESGDREILWAH